MKKHFAALEKNRANYVPLSPVSFLYRTADIFPDRTATIYGRRQYSWSQLLTRSKQLASALQANGVGAGDVVSVIAPNLPEVFEAHFGVPMSGAVLSTINMRLEPSTIAYILEHSDSKLLLCDTAFSAVVQEALNQIEHDIIVIDIEDDQGPGGECIGSMTYDALLGQGHTDFVWGGPEDEWQALSLNYTSGTSGKPKGVVYHHRGSYLMSMGTVSAWQLPLHPTYLYTVPMFHCNGWGHAWTMALTAGTTVILRDIVAADIFNAIADHKVTHFGGAPVVLGLLTNASEDEKRDISHPVNVMTAGAPPPPAILEAVQKLGFEVTQVYGLTETYGHVTLSQWREEWNDEPFEKQAELKSWQGVAFPMTEQAAIIDLETGELVARDSETPGEIVIRGNTVMKGYYKDPEATARAFKDGWFHSGDAAVWHENGYIQIKDRLKDVIISGGENISSVEVESVLYRHPAVAAAAVVARPHDKWGEVPCAFVELKDQASAGEQEVIAFCHEHLAGFKTPKSVIFGELPKTATGKIQKFLLRDRVRDL